MLCRGNSADPQQIPHILYIPGLELSMKIDIKIPVASAFRRFSGNGRIFQYPGTVFGKNRGERSRVLTKNARRNFYELPRQQVHRMYRKPVRPPLRNRELLLPGFHPGRHPRVQPHPGSVHRLYVLPQKVKSAMQAGLSKVCLQKRRLGGFSLTNVPFFCMIREIQIVMRRACHEQLR